jgi:uncharacterized membrane protein
MKLRLVTFFETLRSSFWCVPALMAMVAVGLSFAMVALDEVIRDKVLENLGWIWAGGPEGARALLSAVASSMITVAGVVFSITMVVLTMTSSQFGPRLLRNFMRDTGTQVVLGTFVATFLYCVLVLRTIRSDNGAAFVPYIAVTVGIALALASLGVLIFFIHHTSAAIQVSNVIARVGRELESAIERLFPEEIGQEAVESRQEECPAVLPEGFAHQASAVVATASGYLQAIDSAALLHRARESDCLLYVQRRPGHFVTLGDALVLVWPGERLEAALTARVQAAFILGPERTATQDIEFPVHQLVEIAIRALSPGINDPFTAIMCVDRLGAALAQLAERALPSPYRYDEEKQLRVIAHPVTFAGVADAALQQIRQYGRSSVAVTIRLLETIAVVAAHLHREEDRTALQRQAMMIARGSCEEIPEAWDRQAVEERYQAALKALEQRKK